jgi:hypothetical protein
VKDVAIVVAFQPGAFVFQRIHLTVSIQKKSLAKQKGTAGQAGALCGPSAGLILEQVLLKS